MKFLYGSLMKFSVEKPMVAKKKQRILMLYDFPIKGGGSGIYIKYLSLRLNEIFNYEVAIAAPDRVKMHPAVKMFPIKLPQIPVFIGRPGLAHSKHYSELKPQEISEFYEAFIKETQRVIEEFKPDIIHVHHAMVNAWAARFLRSIYDIKFVITSHGSDLLAISQDKRYARMTRDALNAAHMITVVSADTRSRLLRMFGTDLSNKTRIIPGGVRMSMFPLKKSKESIQKLKMKLNIEGRPVVLFTGRLISEKGVQYLVKAAARINGYVVIVGDGPQKKYLEDLIQENKLTNVKLFDHVDHDVLVGLYYAADVFISPVVIDEGLGLTIIEAMAASKPVVVTRKGGIVMAVKDGYNGLFVRPHNATDIAEKVNRLFADPALAKKMGERSRLLAEEKFTWKKIAARFHRIYSTL